MGQLTKLEDIQNQMQYAISDQRLVQLSEEAKEMARNINSLHQSIDAKLDTMKKMQVLGDYIQAKIRDRDAAFQAKNNFAEIHLRYERDIGKWLKDMEKHPPGPEPKDQSHHVTEPPKLEDLGIGRMQSHRWQAIATIPEDDFEQYINSKKTSDQEITSNGAYALARQIKRTTESKEPSPLPTGQYRTIVVDPPWPMEKILREVRPFQYDMDYPTLEINEIKNLEIPSISSDDGCHLYLWTTQKYLPIAFDVLKDWGFKYIFTMVWHKSGGFQPSNLPQYNCEFVLFGRKGDLEFTTTKDFYCCFYAQRKEHSRKPDEFYDLVRRVSPEPRIDIFSREKRPGFEQYGDETGKFTDENPMAD